MPGLYLIQEAWNWFWYYRHGKVKFRVVDLGDTYRAEASNGHTYIWNCYGSTAEQAKEMALFHLNKAIAESEA